MDGPQDPGDELSVRLQWPADDMEPADAVRIEPPASRSADEAAPALVDAEPEPVDWDESGPAPVVAVSEVTMSPGEVAFGVENALGAISARIDSLTSATTTFRNMVGDRMGDYETRFGKLADSIASDLDDERAWLEQALGILHHGVSEAIEAMRRITATVDELAADVASFQEETSAAVAVLTDEVQGLRRRTSVKPRGGGGGLDAAQLRAVTAAVTEAVTEAVRGEVEAARPPRRRTPVRARTADDG